MPLINSKPEGCGVYQWQTSMAEDESGIFVEYTVVAVVHIYYGDVTLGCRASYVTMKTTYNYVMSLFVDSLT